MNEKSEKKIRQLMRQQIRERLEKLTDEYFGGDAPVFNQKPKYCPKWLWDKLTKIIIDNGFLIQYEIRKKQKEEKRKAEQDYQGASGEAAEQV